MQKKHQIDTKTTLRKIGETIEQLRLVKKISTKEMASALSLSITGYRNIERGLTDISIIKIITISKILEVPPGQLLHSIYEENDTKQHSIHIMTHLKSNHIEEFYRFIQSHKSEINFLKTLLDK